MTSPVKIWRNQKNTCYLAGKNGKIVSWTIIRSPSSAYKAHAPYPVAIVALDRGIRIFAQIVDSQNKDLRKGQKVVCVIRRILEPDKEGIIPYGIKAKPVE